jgi:hypothetical protein
MRLYYTGAEIANTPQSDPTQSLGGLISNSPVPSNLFDNLFGETSITQDREGSQEVIALMLKNESGTTITDLYAHFDLPVDSYKFEIAAVSTVNDEQMESVPNIMASPLTGTFTEADGAANKVMLIASMDAGDVIGIWIRRTVEATEAVDCDTLLADGYETPNTEEGIDLVLEWT